MKNKVLVAGIGILIISIGVVIIIISRMANYFDTSFATEVSLKYYYGDKKIDTVVTDEDDIKIIKENLKGVSYRDNPSCGFSTDISITFSDGEEDVILCIARDSCPVARINNSNRYIEIKDRKALEAVLEKYGFSFPSV